MGQYHGIQHVCGCKYRQWGERWGQSVIGRNCDPKFLNLLKNINPQIQEAQQITRKINTKNAIPRHIIIRYLKSKEKNLQGSQRKKGHTTYREPVIKNFFFTNFSLEIVQARQKSVYIILKDRENLPPV